MTLTLPGRSLEAQFDALWNRFERLRFTRDTLNRWPARYQRWLRPVNLSFVVPVDDEAVCRYLERAQDALRSHMNYAPQPTEMLHITLYQIGYLRTGLPLIGTWTRKDLDKIIRLARQNMALLEPFDVQVGPINAFPNVAIAEVHDDGKLRLLRAAASQAVPRLSRPLPTYPLIPHITLGYFGRRPAEPIREVLRPLRHLMPLSLRIDHVHVTTYSRKPGPYEPTQALRHSIEEVMATIQVGGASLTMGMDKR
jgi:2'-5' RNA ligase